MILETMSKTTSEERWKIFNLWVFFEEVHS